MRMLKRINQLQAASQCCTDRGDAGRDDMGVREGRVWMRESQDETERLMRRGEDGGCLDTEGVGQSETSGEPGEGGA